MEKTCTIDEAEFVASSGPVLKAQPMNEIQTIDIDAVEAHMLTLPPVDCPVEHIFGPGIYIRQIFMPAGAIVLGHEHKLPSLNMVLSGKLVLLADGARREVTAPYIFTSNGGRKVVQIIEDCVFQNIIATDETDIEKIEAMCIEKSPAYMESIQ